MPGDLGSPGPEFHRLVRECTFEAEQQGRFRGGEAGADERIRGCEEGFSMRAFVSEVLEGMEERGRGAPRIATAAALNRRTPLAPRVGTLVLSGQLAQHQRLAHEVWFDRGHRLVFAGKRRLETIHQVTRAVRPMEAQRGKLLSHGAVQHLRGEAPLHRGAGGEVTEDTLLGGVVRVAREALDAAQLPFCQGLRELDALASERGEQAEFAGRQGGKHQVQRLVEERAGEGRFVVGFARRGQGRGLLAGELGRPRQRLL